MKRYLSDPVQLDSGHEILECRYGHVFGEPALQIQISRIDGNPMPYREVWDVFEAQYPGTWAIQAFPPREFLLDQANKYHLYLFEVEPSGINLFRSRG